MSSLTKAQRQQLVRDGRGLILDEARLLYPLIDQDDLDQLSSRLAASRRPASYQDEIKKKALGLAQRLGLRLPTWAAAFTSLASGTGSTSATFSGGQPGSGNVQADESLPDPVDSATQYAEARNKGLPTTTREVPEQHTDAVQKAIEYAERQNRLMRKKD
ncbi:MAG TPA: hypothetical protein VIW80_01690 [Pyrinomonadaceae bacterium]|jgi:hypothetical protein